ncbi:hypothetical protein MtrunA17_Chr7g0250921 [Medicago truncatula]|uniref:KH domain protein n=1 Tax=Medicago truncatula TaxID=3880 RepID=G7KUC0_MEDTR|nr:KH domain protein [Medicago truncatula]RHN47250.1 hypothetical protein MtrunA17_Chr7g0250921 [Medicago truncatula]
MVSPRDLVAGLSIEVVQLLQEELTKIGHSMGKAVIVAANMIGCLIGKGGSIITEMRRLTRSNIRILSKENLPKIASDDDEMVQGSVPGFLPVLPYIPAPVDGPDVLNYDSRDGKRHGRGHSYSSGYGGSSDLGPGDTYGSYASSQGMRWTCFESTEFSQYIAEVNYWQLGNGFLVADWTIYLRYLGME